jgi:TetR/AcrR family transcriptional regulator
MKVCACDRIRKAAIGLFTEKGYAASSTREICERAGVTKPVLYYHFHSKEQLHRELITGACEEMLAELAMAAQAGGTAKEKLVNVLTADFALTRREPDLAALHFRMIFTARHEGSGVDFVKIGMDWVGLLAGIVREGIRRKELNGRPRDIGEAILGIQMIYTMSYLLRGKPRLDRRLARRIMDLVWRGCGRNDRNR